MLSALNKLDAGHGFTASSKVEPITTADEFFGRPEINQDIVRQRSASKCNSGCLALRLPDPPQNAPPTVCSISKDGIIAAVGGRDVELLLWNTDTGELLTKIRGHDIAWTASNNNKFFITVQEDSKVVMWDRPSMLQRHILGQVKEGLTAYMLAPEDDYFICGGSNGGVYSWDTQGGQEHMAFLDGHTGAVQTVGCFTQSNGARVVISCGASDHTVVLWDLFTGNKVGAIVVKELEHAKNVKYWLSWDGAFVLIWCIDSVPFPNLVLVDCMSQGRTSVYCHDGLVRHAQFTRRGEKVISCGADGKVNVWDAMSLECQLSLAGHTGTVLSCSINEDGNRIVSVGEDCTLRLWSVETGKLLVTMEAQDEPIKMCVFSRSGNKVLTCDVSGRVYIWSLHTEFLFNLFRRYADNISSVSLTSDQKLCAVGCNNGRVMLWDVSQRECMWEYSHHTGRVEDVCFNSMHEMIATAGVDGVVTLISVSSGKQINAFLPAEQPVMTVLFSPDDEKVASVVADGRLLVYQANSASRKPKLVLRNNVGRVLNFVWSPNSKLVAGCCSDGTVLVWNATSGSIFSVLEGSSSSATVCGFDMIGKLLAVGTVLGTTLLFNLETAEKLCELKGNASPVREVLFSQDTSRLTTVCSRQAIIWDVATSSKVRIFDFVVDKAGDFKALPHPWRTTVAHDSSVLFDHESEALVYDEQTIEDPLLRSYFLSDTRTIVSGTNHRRYTMWSAAGNTAPDKFHTTHDAITSTHFSYDDRIIVMGTQDGNIVVYDVAHNETVEVLAAHQSGPCRCVRLSADNSEILSCGADSKVILWDWKKRAATKIYSGHFISIGCCDLSSQGNRVVSGDNHGMICVWEKETGNNVQTLPLAHAKAVLSLSMSSDGATLASVGADDKVSVWDVDSGAELVSLTAAMESHPLSCAFSPDGCKLAITETNGNVMVWNVSAGCQWFMIYGAHKGKVTSCSWSADCRKFVTAGADSVMGIWDAESGAPLFKFNVKAGSLTTCAVSPQGVYVAAGSTTGTLSVCNVPIAQRSIPEPSFLYHWLSTHELRTSTLLYLKLSNMNNFLANVQDAQGWSLILHSVNRGNAQVTGMVLEALPADCGMLGIISAVPFSLATQVTFHNQNGDSSFHAGQGLAESTEEGVFSIRKRASIRVSPTLPGGPQPVAEATKFAEDVSTRPVSAISGPPSAMSFKTKKSRRVSVVEMTAEGGSSFKDVGGDLDPRAAQKSMKSFSQNLKKVAVELFAVKRVSNEMDLEQNNALGLALNSRSSECVQVILDAVAANKVSVGGYHAVTGVMPSLSIRYPIMCYHFLAALDLRSLGDLEVPVAVIKGLDRSVIRTAPIFTNVKNLWQSHLRSHTVKTGPQPYAHVRASMVRLPDACGIGKDSMLHTLVESDVPVKVYGTPTLRAVIKHKWRLYARRQITMRAVVYCLYTLLFTVYGILYALESVNLTTPKDYWADSTLNKVSYILDAYLFGQAAYFGWVEMFQVIGGGARFYFKSWWNTLDLLSIILMLVLTPLHVFRKFIALGSALAPMIAFEMLMVWFKTLFYGLAFEPTGPFVHMLLQISWHLRTFTLLLVMTFVSFGTSLMILFQYVPSSLDFNQYDNFGRVMLTMWRGCLGQFEFNSAFESSWSVITIIFLSAFLFIVNIILLNMLIALMVEVYNQTRAIEEDVFLRGRAALIVEVETLMPKKQAERYAMMPPYVHLLTPVHRKDIRSGNSIEQRLERLEQMLMKQAEGINQLLKGVGLGGGLGGGANAVGGGGNGLGLLTLPGGQQVQVGPDGLPLPSNQFAGINGQGGNGGHGHDGYGGDGLQREDSSQLIKLSAARIQESDSQLPAVLRQIDRVQRSVNNQEMRLEGVVTVLRDIENLLRNQQPVVITQEVRATKPRHGGSVMTESELEAEVKRLLGKTDDGKL